MDEFVDHIKLDEKYSVAFKIKNEKYFPWILHSDDGEFPISRESAAGLLALKYRELLLKVVEWEDRLAAVLPE